MRQILHYRLKKKILAYQNVANMSSSNDHVLTTKDHDLDLFFHYDSDVESTMIIKTPRSGEYYLTAHNIGLTFSQGTVPDKFTGYLCVTDTKIDQTGMVHATGKYNRKIGGVLFPICRPQDPTPKCKVYNRIRLEKNDQIKVVFICKDLITVSTDRIVVDFHCVENYKKLYIA